VVELKEKSAFAELGLPFEVGGVTLTGIDLAEMISISPLAGMQAKVSTALQKAVGLGLSDVGRWEAKGEVAVLWTGHNQWFAMGPAGLASKLSKLDGLAGMTGQADGWAVAQIKGKGTSQVLARLCPLDFEVMQSGDAARSEFQHMQSVIRAIDGGFEVMVFRSMARTLVHDIKGAMTSVAAQASL